MTVAAAIRSVRPRREPSRDGGGSTRAHAGLSGVTSRPRTVVVATRSPARKTVKRRPSRARTSASTAMRSSLSVTTMLMRNRSKIHAIVSASKCTFSGVTRIPWSRQARSVQATSMLFSAKIATRGVAGRAARRPAGLGCDSRNTPATLRAYHATCA